MGFQIETAASMAAGFLSDKLYLQFQQSLMKSFSHSLMLHGSAAASWNIFQAESRHHDNSVVREGKKFFLVGK